MYPVVLLVAPDSILTTYLRNSKIMIRSYGLHWRLDRVFWGKQNVPGGLFGTARSSQRSNPIDFRNQRGIYALYAEYELVYIGQTGAGSDRLFNRLKAHTADHLSERWDRFSWFGTQWVTKNGVISKDTATLSETVRASLNILEAVVIAISEPRLNLQRGKWSDATKYFQWWEKDKYGNDEYQ